MLSDREIGVLPRSALVAQSGLEALRGMVEGRHPVPPFAKTSGCYLTEVEDGRVVFVGSPSEGFLNPLGGIHGGWTCGILDSAMACAIHTLLKPGQGYTTLELKVHFVRGVLPTSGELRCEGRIVHRGGTVATSEGYLRDASGRLYAHGTESCLIFDAGRSSRAETAKPAA